MRRRLISLLAAVLCFALLPASPVSAVCVGGDCNVLAARKVATVKFGVGAKVMDPAAKSVLAANRQAILESSALTLNVFVLETTLKPASAKTKKQKAAKALALAQANAVKAWIDAEGDLPTTTVVTKIVTKGNPAVINRVEIVSTPVSDVVKCAMRTGVSVYEIRGFLFANQDGSQDQEIEVQFARPLNIGLAGGFSQNPEATLYCGSEDDDLLNGDLYYSSSQSAPFRDVFVGGKGDDIVNGVIEGGAFLGGAGDDRVLNMGCIPDFATYGIISWFDGQAGDDSVGQMQGLPAITSVQQIFCDYFTGGEGDDFVDLFEGGFFDGQNGNDEVRDTTAQTDAANLSADYSNDYSAALAKIAAYFSGGNGDDFVDEVVPGTLFVGGGGDDQVTRISGNLIPGIFYGDGHAALGVSVPTTGTRSARAGSDSVDLVMGGGTFFGGAGNDTVGTILENGFAGYVESGLGNDHVRNILGGVFNAGDGDDVTDVLVDGIVFGGLGDDFVGAVQGGSFIGDAGNDAVAQLQSGDFFGENDNDTVIELRGGAAYGGNGNDSVTNVHSVPIVETPLGVVYSFEACYSSARGGVEVACPADTTTPLLTLS